jgi:hypothetical protein
VGFLDPWAPTNDVVDLGEVFCELLPTGHKVDMRFHSRAIVRGSRKLLLSLRNKDRTETAEAYDLVSDPGEHDPNPAPAHEWTPVLLAELARRGESLARASRSTVETVPIDEASRERLKALGYGH